MVRTNLVEDVDTEGKLDDAGEEREEPEERKELLVEGAVKPAPRLRLEHEHLLYFYDDDGVQNNKYFIEKIRGAHKDLGGRGCA